MSKGAAQIEQFKQEIFKWDSKTKTLVVESITKEERLNLINHLYKLPGEMDLDVRIKRATQEADKFIIDRIYCDKVDGSRDFIDYWNQQKAFSYSGLLIDDKFYITGDYYFYLNFGMISFKNGKVRPPALRDSDIWFYHLVEKAELTGKYTITAKRRQWGYSLKLLNKLLKRFWFEDRFIGKFAASDDNYLDSGWNVVEGYKDHLNEYTGWYRGLDPSKKGDWQQRTKMEDNSYVGRKSILKTVNIKNKASAIVYGKVDEAFIDEAGIQKNLGEVLGLLDAALRDGNLVTGIVHAGGAAGNMKEAEGLKEIIYNPHGYNMLSLPNVWSSRPEEKVGIFVPAYYSYGSFIDEFGNSDIEGAKQSLIEEGEKQKKKSFSDYQIFKSQNPFTLEDMFAVREENIFPLDVIEPHFEYLDKEYNPTTIEITKIQVGFTHRISDKYDIVTDFPVKRGSNKRGAICMVEPPIPNPPFGLYYAGIDTITPIKTETSVSLQSIHIYKAAHDIDGEYSQDNLVAWYTGRSDELEETFEITLSLMEYYNVRACIENNNRNFIQYLIGKKKTHYIMRRNQLPIIKDLIVNSTVDTSDYGINITAQMKKYLRELLIEYLGEIIDTEFKEDGSSYDIYGVTRIKDKMALKEMLNWSPKKNTDRIDSLALAIFAAKSNSSRGLIVKSDSKVEKKVVNYRRVMSNTQLSGGGFKQNVKLGF